MKRKKKKKTSTELQIRSVRNSASVASSIDDHDAVDVWIQHFEGNQRYPSALLISHAHQLCPSAITDR